MLLLSASNVKESLEFLFEFLIMRDKTCVLRIEWYSLIICILSGKKITLYVNEYALN